MPIMKLCPLNITQKRVYDYGNERVSEAQEDLKGGCFQAEEAKEQN